jgi:hypothetical protein
VDSTDSDDSSLESSLSLWIQQNQAILVRNQGGTLFFCIGLFLAALATLACSRLKRHLDVPNNLGATCLLFALAVLPNGVLCSLIFFVVEIIQKQYSSGGPRSLVWRWPFLPTAFFARLALSSLEQILKETT